MKKQYIEGLRDGVPIGLGYLSVSFGFGITAVNLGIQVWNAIIISMTNLTSAGQVAGIGIIAASGAIIEMILTQLIINIRYALMSIVLTQKLEPSYSTGHKFLTSFFITDEIFATAASKGKALSPSYMYGLATIPYIGWALGTALGAAAGNILSPQLTAALGIAIYGMFVAIVVPAAKKDNGILLAVIISVVLSCVIKYTPVFSFITSGFSIIICSCIASALAALLIPLKENENG